MPLKEKLQSISTRVLRFLIAILLIYGCMIFYLALTERHNAYPRAIIHKEAREVLDTTVNTISCTTKDGTLLEGFIKGDKKNPLILYYPDWEEDATQFLAEMDSIPQFSIVTFNYRGSGLSKGTPSQENFSSDGHDIRECTAQINPPQFIVGRGVGGILAINEAHGEFIILIDPVYSIKEALNYKYRYLYPKFLIRAPDKMNENQINFYQQKISVLLDRKHFFERSHKMMENLPKVTVYNRENYSLKESIAKILSPIYKRDTQ